MTKPTNNPADKARFFALYYGQKVFVYDNNEPNLYTIRDVKDASENGYLQLRSISSLTDDEYLTIALVYGYKSEYPQGIKISNALLIEYGKDICHSKGYEQHLLLADFMRSIGILIPWMGLSCEQIIAFGWVKVEGGDGK